jgi:hypothetical protein
MSLELDNILITGRTFEEYTAFFDLDTPSLKAKKVLDCPSGASSFIAQAKEHGIEAQGSDILYRLPIDAIKKQGLKSIEKIYEDTAWMNDFNFEFYGSIEQHRGYREEALAKFCQDYNPNEYSYNELPHLNFEDNAFDLLLSSHLLFVYDDRFDYDFHKRSILEMLRVAKEVRIFPLVNFKNSRVEEEQNFSPLVYQIIEELQAYQCEIINVDFEFQPRANYMLKITPKV